MKDIFSQFLNSLELSMYSNYYSIILAGVGDGLNLIPHCQAHTRVKSQVTQVRVLGGILK